jgi:hypothetical protein
MDSVDRIKAFTKCFPMVLFSFLCLGGEAWPAEASKGFLHSATHMPALAYFFLGLVFILSVINLLYQGYWDRSGSGLRSLREIFSGDRRKGVVNSVFSHRRNGKHDKSLLGKSRESEYYGYVKTVSGSSVMGVSRNGPGVGGEAQDSAPTPLDGINHPMPQFSKVALRKQSEPRLFEQSPESKSASSDFRFASAVELPSQSEIERREKEQLIVSGYVRGIDSKGLSSVIVYLTDLEGNRLGQSCRSLPETGEFKVVAAEPGKYLLNAYKRGYIVEGEPCITLPIESGKIEGLTFRMAPEGCKINGMVILENASVSPNDLEVSLISKKNDFSRTTRTDEEGRFKIFGVPSNADFFFEVRNNLGKVVAVSPSFAIAKEDEIYREIPIPA